MSIMILIIKKERNELIVDESKSPTFGSLVKESLREGWRYWYLYMKVVYNTTDTPSVYDTILDSYYFAFCFCFNTHKQLEYRIGLLSVISFPLFSI